MRKLRDFLDVLIDIVSERFPNTKIYLVGGGDMIIDCVLELREGNKKLRFSPYELYNESKNHEETIEKFIKEWEELI